MRSPFDVLVLRSGIPDTFPGRLLNICERGLGAMLAGDLAPGETVGVEMLLSTASEPVRARATVRYHSRLQYGLEFMGLSAEQRAAIREWARGTKAETGDGISLSAVADVVRPATPEAVSSVPSPPSGPRSPRKKMHTVSWLVFTVVLVAALAAFWWKWSRSWRELESTLNTSQAEAIKPQAQVPAEMMQRLLLHRVEPIYPRDAR